MPRGTQDRCRCGYDQYIQETKLGHIQDVDWDVVEVEFGITELSVRDRSHAAQAR